MKLIDRVNKLEDAFGELSARAEQPQADCICPSDDAYLHFKPKEFDAFLALRCNTHGLRPLGAFSMFCPTLMIPGPIERNSRSASAQTLKALNATFTESKED